MMRRALILTALLLFATTAHATLVWTDRTNNEALSGTQVVNPIPAQALPGDILIIPIALAPSIGTITCPASMHLIDNGTANGTMESSYYWYLVPNSPPASLTCTWSVSQFYASFVAVHRCIDNVNPIAAHSITTQTASTATISTITPAAANEDLDLIYSAQDANGLTKSTTAPLGWLRILESTGRTSIGYNGGEFFYNGASTASATGTVSLVATQSDNWVNEGILLKDAAGTTCAKIRSALSTTGSGTNTVANAPPGLTAGDVIGAFNYQDTTAGLTVSSPGFTSRQTCSSGNTGNQTYLDTTVGSPAATYTFTYSGTAGPIATLFAMVNTAQPPDGTPTCGNSSSFSVLVAPSITSATPDLILNSYQENGGGAGGSYPNWGIDTLLPNMPTLLGCSGCRTTVDFFGQTAAGASATQSSTANSVGNSAGWVAMTVAIPQVPATAPHGGGWFY